MYLTTYLAERKFGNFYANFSQILDYFISIITSAKVSPVTKRTINVNFMNNTKSEHQSSQPINFCRVTTRFLNRPPLVATNYYAEKGTKKKLKVKVPTDIAFNQIYSIILSIVN